MMPSTRRAFSVAVYARRGERVLVIEHRRLKTWLPIGGELEHGETPLEAAMRELREETGLAGTFRPLAAALDGVPPGLLGYEEHIAGSKGLHMNFVFVASMQRTPTATGLTLLLRLLAREITHVDGVDLAALAAERMSAPPVQDAPDR
jgi:8-oxo-dGTP pyrophosphatase MutT (NUDIX family)